MTPTKRKMLSATAAVAVVGATVVLLGAVMHGARGMGQVQENTNGVDRNRGSIEDHREKTEKWRREIEKVTTKTSTDVGWIRGQMEEAYP